MVFLSMKHRSSTTPRQFVLIVISVTVSMLFLRSLLPELAYILAPIVLLLLVAFLLLSWLRAKVLFKGNADHFDC